MIKTVKTFRLNIHTWPDVLIGHKTNLSWWLLPNLRSHQRRGHQFLVKPKIFT